MFQRSSSGRRSTKGAVLHDGAETQEERKAKSERENQQLLVYLFVCVMLLVAWLLGSCGASFFWVFFLIALTFAVWWNKVMGLLDRHLREQELVLHRRRALRQSETSEWLNFIINRWWVFSSAGIEDLLKRQLDPRLQDIRPPYLESIELKSFTLGDKTPFIKYVHVHEYADGGRKPMSWASVGSPPGGLSRVQSYQVVLETEVGLLCDDFKMVFCARLGGKRMGMNMDLAVERLTINGKLQLVLHLDMNAPFPHLSSVTASFIEKPEVLFAVRVLSLVQVMEIPLLKAWLQRVVEDGFTHALVDPGRVDFKFETYGPTNIPDTVKSKSKAEGVLTVTISGENLKGSVFVDDTRYVQLRLGDEKKHTEHKQAPSYFHDCCSFLVHNRKTDKLTIKSKTKILLSTQTLTQFEVPLADHPLEFSNSITLNLEGKVSKTKLSGATIKLTLVLQYTSLPSVDDIIEKQKSLDSPRSKTPNPAPQAPLVDTAEVSGVMYICVHNAIGLLGLDRNGFSDPYCIIYNNGKKIKTTHYVARTKNPKWNVTSEVIVGDFTKTMLSFIVYDWDGTSTSEDDFLGSAHMILSKSEPVIVRKSLTLGYNLLNMGQVENNNLGSITVSAVFRPVSAVAKSELNTSTKKDSLDVSSGHSRGFISSASTQNTQEEETQGYGPILEDIVIPTLTRSNMCGLYPHIKKCFKRERLSSTKRVTAVKELLTTGQGLLELHVNQAKDLVAADSNGFSDPYCEVRLNNERKFVTSVKKKTLNPTWDEWYTLPLPKQNESLEIIVWDKDAFFQKDFLGAVTFTLDDLKAYNSSSQNAGWFELQRTRSGWVQLHFKIISDDIIQQGFTENQQPLETNQSPDSLSSQTTTDSGISTADPQIQRKPSDNSNVSHRSQKSGRQKTPNTAPATRQEPANYPESTTDTVVTATSTGSTGTGVIPAQHWQNHEQIIPQTPEVSFPSTPTSSTASTRSRKKAVERSASEIDLRVKGKGRRKPTVDAYGTVDRSGMIRYQSVGQFNGNGISRSSSMVSLAPGEKFFFVQGLLEQIRGLTLTTGHIYCKLRLDNRTNEQRLKKFSHGSVISKTSSINIGNSRTFHHSFQLDNGKGVAKEALLIFDVKTSHKEHLTTKGYLLQDLMQGSEGGLSQWIPLEHGIEVELSLSQNPSHLSIPSPKQKHKGGLFSSFRKSKTKLKDH